MHFLLQEKSRKRSEFVIFSCFKDTASKDTRGAKFLACMRASSPGRSGGGAGKGRRACNYVSAIWINICIEKVDAKCWLAELTLAGRDPDLIECNLNHDLSNISDWLVANKLTLNKSKTEFMVIGSRQRLRTLDRSPALAIDNFPISQVASTKSLAVHVDAHLSWNTHISKISEKVASGIGALQRCRPFVPPETLIWAYNSIIQPHFGYCDIVWNNCWVTELTTPSRNNIIYHNAFCFSTQNFA